MSVPAFANLDLQSADSVRDAFLAGAAAARTAACRRGSIDAIAGPGTLIATGDLHDNPAHLARLIDMAGMGGRHEGGAERHEGTQARRHETQGLAHLVLHELIHGDRLMNGMDFSYRVLVKAAALKAAYPEHVHVLLANHELSQVMGAGIIKDGVKVVQAFDEALDAVFEHDAPAVREAIKEFILSLPIALRATTARGDLLVSHSLPGAAMMGRFDASILSRDLRPEDYEARKGSAYWMVWGREYDADQLEDLVERWGVNLFIVGHEKAVDGVRVVPPNAVVLNSDHERGVAWPIDLGELCPNAQDALTAAVPLA
jgi:hypothetical protein